MYFLLLWVSLWRLLTMAACTHCGCHNKLLPTNLWKGPMPACSVSPLPALFTCERLRRSAQPDHCDEGIFQDCLSLGLSLWDPYKSKLFHSAVPHPGCYPCWDCNPFLRGGLALLNALSLSLGWEMPFVVGLTAPVGAGAERTHTEQNHTATSGWFLMDHMSGQRAGEMEI